mmetsp:Transcript_5871/g.8614  ORF Transcript_5871/g.8614 Transcript_5871/m.8614 type:complete len:103 (-) Transcript_5871:399-707(-)
MFDDKHDAYNRVPSKHRTNQFYQNIDHNELNELYQPINKSTNENHLSSTNIQNQSIILRPPFLIKPIPISYFLLPIPHPDQQGWHRRQSTMLQDWPRPQLPK